MDGGAAPSGTITFLFTDVEGSTRLWAADPDAMSASLRLHDTLMRSVTDAHGGYVFGTAGDSFSIAFNRVTAAIDAALAAQAELAATDWGTGPVLRVRMGVHVGEAEERDANYFGPTVNTAARVEAAGHGGQVLVSEAALSSAGVDGIDLGEHLLRDVAEPMRLFQLGSGEFPPLRTTSVGLVSIPSPRTSLVGREEAVVAIRKLVAKHRLVTLTGVGGCGKTRLAIEVADREAPSRPAGVWFVDLSAVSDDTAVPGAVGAALDLVTDDSSPQKEQIATYLASRDSLLVIDNCEHVLDEVADLLDVLIERTSLLRVLATSREALEIEGEHTWRVPSLELGPDSAAVRLFVDRAQATADAFDPDPATAAVIAEVCERLDGIPLAIELAAARVRTMSVADLRDNLDDRFRLLSGGRRRSRQRHQTLEATVQWSYDSLSPSEQAMLRHLAVFQGGFDPADVPAIGNVDSATALDLVDSLAAKSLVDVRRAIDDTVRYRLLETIRLFALQRLVESGDAEATRDRHLDQFSSDPGVRDWGHYCRGSAYWRIEREFENLRGAAGWALGRGRVGTAAVFGSALADQCIERGEANQLLTWLGEIDHLEPAEQVRCLAIAAHVRGELLDLDGGLACADTAIEIAGEHPFDMLPMAHCFAAKMWMIRLDFAAARDHIERALAVAPQTRSWEVNVSAAFMFRAAGSAAQGSFTEAIADGAEALRQAPDDFIYRSVIRDYQDLALFFAGREPSRAQQAITGPADGTPRRYRHVSKIVDAIVAIRHTSPEFAARALATAARESVARRPDTVGDWLSAFACIEALSGERSRAVHVLRNSIALYLPAMRPGVELLLAAGSSGASAASSATDEQLTSISTNQPDLLAEEIAYWS